jgi:uncharacterized protein YecE (DUF72 family)
VTPAAIHIGTSGWHYNHWRGPFYPERLPASKMLASYCERFDTVELNNTFYRLPSRKALEEWRGSTPENFCFAVKGSRFITHMKKLKDPELALAKFFAAIEVLGRKLGPILFQLPPRWELNLERFSHFLACLPPRHRYAFEFRNPAWDAAPVYDLMRHHRAGYCIFHLAGTQSPVEVTADFAYIRLHGPGGKYQGSYSDAELRAWARRIRDWRARLKAVYVYFDNDQAGHAAHNALRLKELLA